MTVSSRFWLVSSLALSVSGCVPMLVNEAETPAAEGRVLDGVHGEAVADVTVTLFSEYRSGGSDPIKVTAFSDQAGYFDLEERSRRRVILGVAGSRLVEYPLIAHEEAGDRAAYSLIQVPGGSRAGSPGHQITLLLLPENPQPLPLDCQPTDSSAYALHAAERLPEWRNQAWFGEQLLSDTATLRQFADSLYELLYRGFGSPACSQSEEVAERVAMALGNVQMLIDQEPAYRSSASGSL